MRNTFKTVTFFCLAAIGFFAGCQYEDEALPARIEGQTVLNPDTYNTKKNQPIRLTVLDNDSITTDGVLTFGQAAHGSITTDSAGFLYQPNQNYLGADQFYYKYCTDAVCDSALVIVNVSETGGNCSIKANRDFVNTSVNQPLNISFLANDVTCGPVTISNHSFPINGKVSILPNNDFLYTPNPGYVGGDSLVYEFQTPAGQRAVANIYITVNSNCNPQAKMDVVNTYMNDTVTIYPARNDSTCNATFPIKIVSNPQHGIARLLSNNRISYQPGYNYVGSDIIEYEICNGPNKCSRNFITINTQIPVINCSSGFMARHDSIPLPSNPAATNFYFNVLANDTYCPQQLISLTIIQAPNHGTAFPVMYNGVIHINYVKTSPPALAYSDVIWYEIRMNVNGQVLTRSAKVTVVFR